MADLYIDLKDKDPAMLAAYLRAQALAYDPQRWRRREFWVGVVFGACLIAGMNLGDVHLCIGQCDGAGALHGAGVEK